MVLIFYPKCTSKCHLQFVSVWTSLKFCCLVMSEMESMSRSQIRFGLDVGICFTVFRVNPLPHYHDSIIQSLFFCHLPSAFNLDRFKICRLVKSESFSSQSPLLTTHRTKVFFNYFGKRRKSW